MSKIFLNISLKGQKIHKHCIKTQTNRLHEGFSHLLQDALQRLGLAQLLHREPGLLLALLRQIHTVRLY